LSRAGRGRDRRATKPGGGKSTENQCLRIADRYIYAAQFHIEMAGTPENSRRIMGNFLSLAKAWGGDDRVRTHRLSAQPGRN
jgi:GMP synthase-like glutamine amidotransferase